MKYGKPSERGKSAVAQPAQKNGGRPEGRPPQFVT